MLRSKGLLKKESTLSSACRFAINEWCTILYSDWCFRVGFGRFWEVYLYTFD
jgi:hypothetical protein